MTPTPAPAADRSMGYGLTGPAPADTSAYGHAAVLAAARACGPPTLDQLQRLRDGLTRLSDDRSTP